MAPIDFYHVLEDQDDQGLISQSKRLFRFYFIRVKNKIQIILIFLESTKTRQLVGIIFVIQQNSEIGYTIWSHPCGEYSQISTGIPQLNNETTRHNIEFLGTNGTHTLRIEWDSTELYIWENSNVSAGANRYSEFCANPFEVQLYCHPFFGIDQFCMKHKSPNDH
ncbi:hypothetical protein RF11_10877 [Thelohanellus kitauei]|uniref:Uncharacterized protein n=1 Tax=Thelohanellus kitauei TaxID=669202 RepID=A0A0C2M912_THEKT|nr:hypothetical protein RF11_10877 [Thelohanellus kitauei]